MEKQERRSKKKEGIQIDLIVNVNVTGDD